MSLEVYVSHRVIPEISKGVWVLLKEDDSKILSSCQYVLSILDTSRINARQPCPDYFVFISFTLLRGQPT